MKLLEQITAIGWRVVELAFVLVALCVLLSLLLGKQSGTFIASVAANTSDLLQKLPPGALVGVFLIFAVYWLIKNRTKDQK